ncbi:MAG: hypothetical protein KDC25_11165 [Saprospiraceae bacterium]|nr:hypothetical protein [Saprospiraceae bacterium]
MGSKTILGLDLGTNSIGWALVKQNFEDKTGEIVGMGSRIIPMSQDIKDEFGKGNSISQTAERTRFRGIRRIRERQLLRRERLHRVLNILGFLPNHYQSNIDFKANFGKFLPGKEPKLAYNGKTFIFKSSFEEMLQDFKVNQPALIDKGKLVPQDWTIYYLRKKALTEKIEKEELAWILLNFNQKRGYYQLRGEEEDESPSKLIEFHSLKIVDVQADEPLKGKSEIWYSLILENGWVYRRSSKLPLFDWKDKVRDFIVTTDLNEDGSIKTDKEGVEKRSFRAPSENDWTLQKKKTEQDISASHKTVGAYVYDTLLQQPNQKIKGKLVRTIERKFYKSELREILKSQIRFHPELQDSDLYMDCIKDLYRNNEAQQISLSEKGIGHLLIDDIIFYQRPLRSQKSSISNCPLEFRKYYEDNVEKTAFIKVIPKSHPLYQEFRLWQWIYNLQIYQTEVAEVNVTSEFINSVGAYEDLFAFLNDRKEIEQKPLIKYFLEKRGLKGKALNEEAEKYRWNFVQDKKYPCNETAAQIFNRLNIIEGFDMNKFPAKQLESLWHIIYSVTDKIEYEKALHTFARNHGMDEEAFVENFKRFPPFKSEYGSVSEKAIKRLLPLLRIGKYWSWDAIDLNTRVRIANIINGEFDAAIKDRVREKAIHLTEESHFQGLQLWLASYVVYGRHSEVATTEKWNSAADLRVFLKEFKQHSLRNPIVEQIVTETLRVVNDIWENYGKGNQNFFDEIHVELGREMKNTADERKKITQQVSANESTNLRIKALLAELLDDGNVENVRPYSPIQQEALKIYEDGVLNSSIEIPEDILKISKTAQPSGTELRRYKLWLEQRYCSPYTGQIIPLNRLFTTDYEIEHIIPQSRYFDDSFNNKVICETAINKLKDKQLSFEFIKNHGGSIVETGFGKSVKVLGEDAYKEFVKVHYSKNNSKRNKLLLEEIPDKMIERQLNDTRYISKYISRILSNIVRAETNDDGVNSKNVLPGNGTITSILKQDWGLNDVWNELILPRFERMNQLTESTAFTSWNENHQKYLPTVPIEFSKGFQKKRIDHRHHAMDALVIACATRDHINLLNNQYAKSKVRYDLNRKLRNYKKVEYNDSISGERVTKEIASDFIKPWKTFTEDVMNRLSSTIVSFKKNVRVINKTSNLYEKWVDVDGKKVKQKVRQTVGDNWAIRKPLHKDTVYGRVRLQCIKNVAFNNALDNISEIVNKDLRKYLLSLVEKGYDKKKISKHFKETNNEWNGESITRVDIFYWDDENVASRVSLDTSFNEKKIASITDTGIQKILLAHLENYRGIIDEKGKEIAPELAAFTPEGIDEMNKNIIALNGGRNHQPIRKVRTYEPKGNKFNVGYTGNKQDKYVEAAKGTNLFFAVYATTEGKRNYATIPLNEVIERKKQGLSPVPYENADGDTLLFHLSPNDLVYIPTDEELAHGTVFDLTQPDDLQVKRIYKMVSCTGNECLFVKHDVASAIVNKVEFSTLNKMGRDLEGNMIKDRCVKILVDKLGKITWNSLGYEADKHDYTSTIAEPETQYNLGAMQTYDSHAASNEADAQEMAQLSENQHLENTNELMRTIYKDEIEKPMDKNLNFD